MKQIALLTFLLAFSSLALSQQRIIAVEGSGSIEAVPDLIRISYTVIKMDKDDPSRAKASVDDIASNSVQALVEAGLSRQDITSSSLTVETVEDYDNNGNSSIVGHLVSRDIDIVIRDIGLYGEVIQLLVNNQVSEITKVEPDLSNYEELKREALAAAARNAKNNAEFLAKQFGAELGKIHQIGKQNIQRQFSLEEIVVTAQKKGSLDAKTTAYEFAPGKVKVSSDVYVEYQLR